MAGYTTELIILIPIPLQPFLGVLAPIIKGPTYVLQHGNGITRQEHLTGNPEGVFWLFSSATSPALEGFLVERHTHLWTGL